MVLGNFEEEASTAEGLVHHEGSVELAEDLGRSTPFSLSRLAFQNFSCSREFVPAQATRVLSGAQVKPRRVDNPTRLTLVVFSRRFNW
jgi:hypothetical protein